MAAAQAADASANSDACEAAELPKKMFHIFISYRVASDALLAERLCDKLQQQDICQEKKIRVKCFLDKQNLVSGENWEQGFLNGLASSCLFLPVMSAAGLAPIGSLTPDKQDNVLLEYERALAMRDNGAIEILPVLVGTYDDARAFHRFRYWGPYPDVPSKTNPSGTVKATMATINAIQGIFCDPNDLARTVALVRDRLESWVWPRFQAMWANADEIQPEQQFTCVQCDQSFVNSHNGQGACKFPNHSAFQDYARVETFGRARHRATHHHEYEYTNYVPWFISTVGWKSSAQILAEFSVSDYATNSAPTVCVGIARHVPEDGQLFVSITHDGSLGRAWFFTAQTIAQAARFGWLAVGSSASGRVKIEWRAAEAVPDTLLGLVLSISTTPLPGQTEPGESSVMFVPLNTTTLELAGEPVVECDARFAERLPCPSVAESQALYASLMPATPVQGRGPVLPNTCPQAPDSFKTVQTVVSDAAQLPLRVKLTTAPTGTASYRARSDAITIPIVLMNLSESQGFTLVDLSARWRFYGQADWKDIEPSDLTFRLLSSSSEPQVFVPLRVDSGAAHSASIQIVVHDESKKVTWSRATWLARFTPVQFEVTFESKSGALAVVVIPFANPPTFQFTDREKPDPNMALLTYADCFERCWRHQATLVLHPDSPMAKPTDIVFNVTLPSFAYTYSVEELRKVAFEAIKASTSEFVAFQSSNFDDAAALDADVQGRMTMYVDLASRRVYAVSLLVRTRTSSAYGVCVLPMYGNTSEIAAPASPPTALEPITQATVDAVLAPSVWQRAIAAGANSVSKIVRFAQVNRDDNAASLPLPSGQASTAAASGQGATATAAAARASAPVPAEQPSDRALLLAILERLERISAHLGLSSN